MAEPRESPPRESLRTWLLSRLSWGAPLSLLIMALVAVPVRMLEDEGLPRYQVLRAELEKLRRENDLLRHELLDLESAVGALRNDPAAVERIARDELGMLRSDELVLELE